MMRRDADRRKLFERRAALLAGGKALLLSTLIGRMYYLQVVESPRYKTMADDNRISLRLLPPPRGDIVDRYGRPLAVNRQNYRISLISEDIWEKDQSVKATLNALSRVVDLGEKDRRRVLQEVRRHRSFVPITVRENLTWEEVARIEVNAPDLPGVIIDVGESRHYPYGDELAHVLGYVAAPDEKDMTGDPLLELPDFRIGKAGVEKAYDLALRGRGGASEVEVNAMGRVIQEIKRQEGQPGAEIRLTVDLGLQRLANRSLTGKSGAVVLIDINDGGVLAMASAPSFDPNAFSRGLASAEWRALLSNARAPLTNKALSGQYAPGSTFKMAVALAALHKGVLSPSANILCKGSVTLGDNKFHCWKERGHGQMDMTSAISQSCDVYFYEAARRTGIEDIVAMARKLGLGSPLGFDLPGEEKGLLPSKDWKMNAFGIPWQQGETLLAGIGQGYFLLTPLQLAVMVARLASDGKAVRPRIIAAIDGKKKEREAFDDLQINQAHLKLIRAAMVSVVNDPKGTAHRSRVKEEGMKIAGKTGTVQVRRIGKAEREQGVRKNKDLPWEERDHALFAGFAPVGAPRYAIAVVVEHGGGGATTAAPIARDILHEAMIRRTGEGVIQTVLAGKNKT